MNKHGWGLRKELAFILLFVFCLLIAMVGLSQFGLTEDSSDKTSYKTLENKLTSAALEYYKDKYNPASGDVVIIKFSTLKNNGYISKFEDVNGLECNGYTKIVNSDVGVSYIRCFGYKTNGYDSQYE
mgnify:FL=1